MPKPEAGLTLKIKAVANEEMSGGTLRVTLPEAAAAENAGPNGRPYWPAGVPVPVTARVTIGRLPAGAQIERSVPITFRFSGYYRVAVVSAAEGPPSIEDGRYIYNQTYHEIWVLVTADGGRVTSRFEPSLLPDGVLPQPGRFTQRRSVGHSEASILSGLMALIGLLRNWLQSSDPVFVEVLYYDGFQYRPAADAELYSRYYNPWGDEYLADDRQIVPEDGIVLLGCPAPGEEWHVQIDLSASNLITGMINIGDGVAQTCGDTTQVFGAREPYEVWQDLRASIPVVNSHLGYSRPRVGWWIDYNASGSFYSSGDDIMTFAPNATRWTVSHEYGHALHHASLGGLWSADNCNPHFISQPSSYTCALQEGFADYLGDIGAFDGDASGWESFHVSDRPAEVEGNIAALFHDLHDFTNESGDATTFGPYYSSTVFKSCQVRVSTFWSARNDPSDFVWCLENRIDGALHEQQFPGIATPSGVAESATDWSPDDIRTTWLTNIGQ